MAHIGDLLTSTPVYRLLKNHFPEAQITLVASPTGTEILNGNPYIDELIPCQSKYLDRISLASRLLKRRLQRDYDILINLHLTPPSSRKVRYLAKILKPDSYIELDTESMQSERKNLKNSQLNSIKPISAWYIEVLSELGISAYAKNPSIEIYLDEEEKKESMKLLSQFGIEPSDIVIALFPGIKNTQVRWSEERFAELANRIYKEGIADKLLICGTPDEKPITESISNMMSNRPIILAGMTTIRQISCIIERCNLAIAHDSGSTHIASAVGTPNVIIYGHSLPGAVRPVEENEIAIYKGYNLECSPCYSKVCEKGTNQCMEEIAVSEVFEAVKEVINSRK